MLCASCSSPNICDALKDEYTSRHIYINKDLTKAEVAAAYEQRCRRRELNKDTSGQSNPATRVRTFVPSQRTRSQPLHVNASTTEGRLFSKQSEVLHCILINARSVVNKLPDLYTLLYDFMYDCVFVTESWLQTHHTDGLLDPEGRYNVFRCDRNNQIGGGVCILIVVSCIK
jgi:hypothetical protein